MPRRPDSAVVCGVHSDSGNLRSANSALRQMMALQDGLLAAEAPASGHVRTHKACNRGFGSLLQVSGEEPGEEATRGEPGKVATSGAAAPGASLAEQVVPALAGQPHTCDQCPACWAAAHMHAALRRWARGTGSQRSPCFLRCCTRGAQAPCTDRPMASRPDSAAACSVAPCLLSEACRVPPRQRRPWTPCMAPPSRRRQGRSSPCWCTATRMTRPP